MYVLRINGHDYQSIERWDELTLKGARKLMKLIAKMPQALGEIYQLMCREQTDESATQLAKLHEQVTDEQRIKLFPKFYGDVLCVMSNIPQKVMTNVMADHRTAMFQFSMDDGVSCESVIMGLMGVPFDYQLQGITQFKWGDEVLVLPKSKTVLGTEIPMADEQIITFAEASDLEITAKQIEGGRFDFMSNMIAILCRPEGEQYDEDVSLQRAQTMDDLPMSIVWDVFFCSISRLHILEKIMLSCLRAQVSGQQRQSINQVLDGGDGTDKSLAHPGHH